MRDLTERLATALASDDLVLRESACDLDKVITSGWAARNRQLGAMAFRAKYLHANAKDFAALVRKIAVSRARQKRRMEPREEIHRLADSVVAWWLHDKCPVCHGRGMMVLEGQQITSVVCKECGGSTFRTMPSPKEAKLTWERSQFERRFSDIQVMIDSAVQSYLANVKKGLHK